MSDDRSTASTARTAPWPHLGDALSRLVDGELSLAEEAEPAAT